jgi:hypothetical protein
MSGGWGGPAGCYVGIAVRLDCNEAATAAGTRVTATEVTLACVGAQEGTGG